MYSLNFVFVTVFIWQHVVVEAVPLTDVALLDIVSTMDIAQYDVSNTSSPEIPSSIGLEEFGNFRTLPLEEVINNPALINTTTAPDDVSSSSLGETKIAEPHLEDLAAATSCTSPQTRIEWRSYSSSDRQAYVDAIACLANLPSAGSAYSPSTSRYEDFVRTHQKMTPTVHGNGIFIFWHRYFVYAFEQALRTQCNFGNRPMPWWDETKDSGELYVPSTRMIICIAHSKKKRC